MDVDVRLLRATDAPALAALVAANEAFLAPYEPLRDETWTTEETQRAVVETALGQHATGTHWPGVVVVDGELAGRVTVSDVVRGPFRSGHLGYWVSEHVGGRGVASAAVARVLELSFAPQEAGGLDLHRLQAATLPDNARSQAVLRRNGFEEIGYAPRYLRIAGRWQDHVLFQRLADG